MSSRLSAYTPSRSPATTSTEARQLLTRFVAMFRQALGFALYRSILDGMLVLNQSFGFAVGFVAAFSKTTAVVIEYPISLYKNRLQLKGKDYSSKGMGPRTLLFRGLYAVVACQAIFTLTHFTLYSRYVEGSSGYLRLIYGYLIAVLSTFVSHPFEVLRNLSIDT